MTLQASISALYHDAGSWDDVASVTRTAAGTAAGLTLDESQLSWASNPTGLLVTYEELRAKVERLLTEATTNLTDMASALRTVARAYENSDERASVRFDGEWEPVR